MNRCKGSFDVSVRRESACPVHFVWDGAGRGRPFVRVGFLLALVAGALVSFAAMSRVAVAHDVGVVVAVVAAFCWSAGQGMAWRSRGAAR